MGCPGSLKGTLDLYRKRADTEGLEHLFNDDQPPLLVTSTVRNRILTLVVVDEWSWDEARIGQLEAVAIYFQDE
jgi:hypothetical protein